MGCGMPGPGGSGTHKVFGRNFTMGGHPQSFGRKTEADSEILGDLHIRMYIHV